MPRYATGTPKRADRKAEFAELIANGAEPIGATRAMGLTRGQGARVWKLIKRDLGEQAV